MQTATGITKSHSLSGAIIIALGVIIIISGTYLYLSDKTAEPVSVTQPEIEETPVIAAVTVQQAVTHAVDEVASKATAAKVKPAITLPPLNDSDAIALESAQQLSSLPQYLSLLVKQEIIRNFVVFVDNFSRGELVTNFSPLSKPGSPFSIVKVDQQMYLNTESYNRYNIYAEIISSIDIASAIRQYRALKPLFDEAYQEIGYPQTMFDDSLNQAIEVVLDTPVIDEAIALVAPSAMYKFASPELEALPDAQKLLMRMGPDNIVKLQTKLRQMQLALQRFKASTE